MRQESGSLAKARNGGQLHQCRDVWKRGASGTSCGLCERGCETKRTLYYQGRTLAKVGNGYKYNHVDERTGEKFWISGPKKNGEDGLYGHRPVPIDEDVREEYWVEIRRMPAKKG